MSIWLECMCPAFKAHQVHWQYFGLESVWKLKIHSPSWYLVLWNWVRIMMMGLWHIQCEVIYWSREFAATKIKLNITMTQWHTCWQCPTDILEPGSEFEGCPSLWKNLPRPTLHKKWEFIFFLQIVVTKASVYNYKYRYTYICYYCTSPDRLNRQLFNY